MITILNSSILTDYGIYVYQPISLQGVKDLIKTIGFESAIGHQSTCDVLTILLGQEVPLNRIQYKQESGAVAIIFKLRGRLEEGKILTPAEIEAVGYDFGLLTKEYTEQGDL